MASDGIDQVPVRYSSGMMVGLVGSELLKVCGQEHWGRLVEWHIIVPELIANVQQTFQLFFCLLCQDRC